MSLIGLFYGSSGGNTKEAAQMIQKEFHAFQPEIVTLHNIAAHGEVHDMENFEKLIIGVSTWTDGELQEDWLRAFGELEKMDLSGKQAALFGLGDQRNYPEAFQDALGTMARKLREHGAQLVGFWPTTDYSFTSSQGVENGMFMGLALDNDNELHLTPQRIKNWVGQLRGEFGLQQ
jgi:flavodoxin I